jgi:hypothetical protein
LSRCYNLFQIVIKFFFRAPLMHSDARAKTCALCGISGA